MGAGAAMGVQVGFHVGRNVLWISMCEDSDEL